MIRRWFLVTRLAAYDLLHEHRLTICSFVGLSAVLLPLIMLWGLKNGIVEGLRADLIENPRTRTLVNQANRAFTADLLARIAARPDVAFVAPRLRTLNSEARFEQSDRPTTSRRAELLSTGAGDPLLGPAAVPGPDEVVLTATLADRLGATEGSTVVMRVSRSRNTDFLALPLRVRGVAPRASFGRDAAFIDLRLMVQVDDFLEGKNAPDAASIDPDQARERTYAGFRVHARRLEDVLTLETYFRREDVDVETHGAEISGLLQLDRSLTLLFAALAGLGATGYLVSLGVGLYAAVERKQIDLSLLRLIGMRRGTLVLVPVTQAIMIALCGSTLAALVSLGAGAIVNQLPLGASGANPRPICLIETWQLEFAIGVTILSAAAAAGFAGRRAARISPAEGIQGV